MYKQLSGLFIVGLAIGIYRGDTAYVLIGLGILTVWFALAIERVAYNTSPKEDSRIELSGTIVIFNDRKIISTFGIEYYAILFTLDQKNYDFGTIVDFTDENNDCHDEYKFYTKNR